MSSGLPEPPRTRASSAPAALTVSSIKFANEYSPPQALNRGCPGSNDSDSESSQESSVTVKCGGLAIQIVLMVKMPHQAQGQSRGNNGVSKAGKFRTASFVSRTGLQQLRHEDRRSANARRGPSSTRRRNHSIRHGGHLRQP